MNVPSDSEERGQTRALLGHLVTLSPCHLVILSCLLAGCSSLPGRPDPADRPLPTSRVVSFEALFRTNCAGCHGADGKLGPAPPLNDPLFRAIIPEEEVRRVITEGRRGTLMPAFGREGGATLPASGAGLVGETGAPLGQGPLLAAAALLPAGGGGGRLTAAQVEVLVKEIKGIPYKVVRRRAGDVVVADGRGLAPKWGVPPPPPARVPPYRAGPAGDRDEGAMVFLMACSGCHGEDGRGGKDAGPLHSPALLSLLSSQVLRRLAITGRPDLGMPDYAGKEHRSPAFRPLTSQDVADLVALLESWRDGGPAHAQQAAPRSPKR